MGSAGFRRVGLLVSVAIVAGAATAFGDLSGDFSSHAAPVPGHGAQSYLQMTGAQTGKFNGGVTAKGFLGAIPLLAIDMPSTDPATVTPCASIEFRMPSNPATPLVFDAARSGEQITKAVFSEVKPSQRGDLTFLRITVQYGNITAVHHVDATTTGAYEDVTLSPTTVQIQYLPSHTSTNYNCQNT